MTSIFFLRSLIREFSAQDIRLEHLTGTLVIIMLMAALVCFLVSEITRNYSQVDKLWSFMPVIYSLLALATFHSARILKMSILVTVWGIRLSFKWLNWTLAGSLLLVLLFLGSTALTERISSSKYRGYADYKKDVPKYFPRIFRTFK